MTPIMPPGGPPDLRARLNEVMEVSSDGGTATSPQIERPSVDSMALRSFLVRSETGGELVSISLTS